MPRRLVSAVDSDSSSDEDDLPSLSASYKAIDIRRGLLSQATYRTAVHELERIISCLYRGRQFEKEARRLVEADVHIAINECSRYGMPFLSLTPLPFVFHFHRSPMSKCSAELDCRALQLLMAAVEKSFPQAKRQALAREFKQRMLQFRRAGRRQQGSSVISANDSSTSDSEDSPPSFVNLPRECMDIILQHLDPSSLAMAACTCKSWHKAATVDELWEPLLKFTFGSGALPSIEANTSENADNTQFYHCFSRLSVQYPEWLLPWTTDRITCHGVVRWISHQTRDRVMAAPGPAGVAWNRSVGVAFLTPDEVVVWLDRRTPKWLAVVMTTWRRREQERLRAQRSNTR